MCNCGNRANNPKIYAAKFKIRVYVYHGMYHKKFVYVHDLRLILNDLGLLQT